MRPSQIGRSCPKLLNSPAKVAVTCSLRGVDGIRLKRLAAEPVVAMFGRKKTPVECSSVSAPHALTVPMSGFTNSGNCQVHQLVFIILSEESDTIP